MQQPDAVRTCPYCHVHEVPKLIVWPRRMTGSATNWQCRSCDRHWSDTQLLAMSA
jgi:hypothetical protein